MDASEKWMIFPFTPHQTTTLPKWIVFKKLLFKSSLLLNGQCCIQVRPPKSIDDLCLLFCINPSYMVVVGREPQADQLSLLGGNIFLLERATRTDSPTFGIMHLRQQDNIILHTSSHPCCTLPIDNNSLFMTKGLHSYLVFSQSLTYIPSHNLSEQLQS